MGADASVGQLHQYLVVVVNGKVRPPMVAVPVTVTEPWAGMANEHFVGPGDLVFPFTTGGHRRGGEIRDMFYAALDDAGPVRLRERSPPIRFHDLRIRSARLPSGCSTSSTARRLWATRTSKR